MILFEILKNMGFTLKCDTPNYLDLESLNDSPVVMI